MSLGTEIITTNNTDILITAIGENVTGGLSHLICHTDLVGCCRANHTIGAGSVGEWLYPNGTVVPNDTAEWDFYSGRNDVQVVSLSRRIYNETAAISPVGLYCCVIPTTTGEQTFCANLGNLSLL